MCAVLVGVGRAQAVLAAPDPEQTVSDPERTRVITIAIVAMIVAGVAVIAVTVWFWRSTRPEPPALAPLEVMGERSFVRADADEQQRRLEQVRPPSDEVEPTVEPTPAAESAEPAPSVAAEPVVAEPEVAAVAEPEVAEPEVAAVGEPDASTAPADADDAAEVHEDHTPEGDERPSADGDQEAPPPAIDPLLGRFQ